MQFKRGRTFNFSAPITAKVNGESVTDVTGWTGKSNIRKPDGTLIADLVVTFPNTGADGNPPVVNIAASGSTAAWPIGAAVMDIEFTNASGGVDYTDTMQLTIVERVTRP